MASWRLMLQAAAWTYATVAAICFVAATLLHPGGWRPESWLILLVTATVLLAGAFGWWIAKRPVVYAPAITVPVTAAADNDRIAVRPPSLLVEEEMPAGLYDLPLTSKEIPRLYDLLSRQHQTWSDEIAKRLPKQ